MPLLHAPTARTLLLGCAHEREAWTDIGDFGVVRRALLRQIDKFSQQPTHPVPTPGWTPPVTLTQEHTGGKFGSKIAIRIITRITTLDNSQEAEPAIGRGRCRVIVWSVRHWALGLSQEPTLVSLTA